MATNDYPENYIEQIDKILADVRAELIAATKMYEPMHSAHEGHSVIREELEKELWDEVCAKQHSRTPDRMRKEAVQVSAMAARFILDICDGGRYNK